MEKLIDTLKYRGQTQLYQILNHLNITFDYYEHPPAPTIEEARKYWKDINAMHCKNLFFRNHKGNQHYLIVLDHNYDLNIHNIEKHLKQGKLTLASEHRLNKYLNISPGSVSPFALINDKEQHVHVLIDQNIKYSSAISFHPNVNTASLVIKFDDFIKFLNFTKNKYQFVKLYD